jgi:hypothetical protein
MEAGRHVWDWRLGSEADLGAVNTSNLLVDGLWAVWRGSGDISRRELSAGTTVTVPGSSNSLGQDVGPNGDVVYAYNNSIGWEVARFRGGVVEPIPPPLGGQRFNRFPLTDGINVVYWKGDPGGGPTSLAGQVAWWNDTTETLLTPLINPLQPNQNYAVNGGWIAYTVVDGGGATQIRVRAPNGTDLQVTSAAGSSLIRGLASDGTLVYANAGSIFARRAPFSSGAVRVGRDWFRVSFRGSELLLFLGNSAFHASY